MVVDGVVAADIPGGRGQGGTREIQHAEAVRISVRVAPRASGRSGARAGPETPDKRWQASTTRVAGPYALLSTSSLPSQKDT